MARYLKGFRYTFKDKGNDLWPWKSAMGLEAILMNDAYRRRRVLLMLL